MDNKLKTLYDQAVKLFERSGIEPRRMEGGIQGIPLDPNNPQDRDWYENDEAYDRLVDQP